MNGTSSNEISHTCTKVGTMKLVCIDDAILKIRTYYSSTADETIVSPGDVTISDDNPFHIWTQVSNIKTGRGHIKFRSEDGVFEPSLNIVLCNGLWYTTHSLLSLLPDRPSGTPTLYKLSTDVHHELWHQRLGHPGQKITQTISSCVHGVPKIHQYRNHFYQCDSCLKAKISKQPKPKTTPSTVSKFGQWFHMDFGFARGSDFKYENHEGRIITSRNGYNAYLSIIGVYIRYQWLCLTANK